MTEALSSLTADLASSQYEAERLAALRRYQILDTPPEQAFDRITALAARLFAVPTVVIALVDESRVWFKSCYGCNPQEVPRETCTWPLLYDPVRGVSPAGPDDRLACNPSLAGERGLGFYTSAPLLTPEGWHLGALCLLDTQPRPDLTEEQQATLVDLAAIVMDALEGRRATIQQREAERERQQAEEICQTTTQRLQLYADVVQSIQVGIAVWQLEVPEDAGSFRLVIANPAASTLTGFDFASFLGKTMAEGFPKVLEMPLAEQYLEVVQTGRSIDIGEVVYEDQQASGTYSLKAFPLPNRCLGLAFENITDRKQIEAQLQASQRYNQQIAEALPGVLFVHDVIHQCNVYANRQITDLLGYTPEQVQALGSNAITTLIHPDDLERVFTYFATFGAVSDGTVLATEYQARHASEEWRWFYTQGVVFNRTPEGAPQQVLGVSIDITDRKQAEAALQASEERYRLLAEAMPQIVWTTDAQGQATYFNSYWYDYTGLSATESMGFESPNALHPEDRDRVFQHWLQAVATGEPYEIEVRLRRQDGAYRWFLCRGLPVQDGKGQIISWVGTSTDIDDQKHVQAALRQSEERLSLALRAARAGMWQWFTAENHSIWSNENYGLIGYEPGQCVPSYENWLQAVHPDDRAAAEQAIQQSLADNTPFYLEYRVCLPDGSLRWLANSGQVTYDAEGNQEGMIGLQIDINQRKHSELERERSEAILNAFLAASPIALTLFDRDLRFIYANEALAQLNALPLSQHLGRTLEEVVPDMAPQFAPLLQQILDTQEPVLNLEYSGEVRPGAYRSTIANHFPVCLPNGEVLGVGVTVVDITELKRIEVELRQHSERLNLLYETTRELLSAQQPMELMNRLFHRLSAQMDLHYYYHFQISQRQGQPYLRLVSHEGLSAAQAEAVATLELGQALCGLVAQEQRQIVLNQAEIAVHPNARIVSEMGISAYAGQPLIVQGRLLGTLSFASRTRSQFTPEESYLLRAISEQVAIALDRAELVASLQQQTDDLAQANRVKDEFLAVLSHELRSPLNPILGWTKLLQTGKFDAQKTKQALEIIERNAKQQTQLIDDLLDISRILRGKLVLSEAPVDLACTINAALETVRLAAEAKEIQVMTDLSGSLPPVLGDASRLQQIVLNLFSNAVKFTPNGGWVVVRLAQVGSEAEIQVQDSGKGIAPDFLPYVFDSFRQEDGKTTRKFGGLGLGLAIVRQLTELHGGTVRADSPGEGAGATFTIRLPLMRTEVLRGNAPHCSPMGASPAHALQGIRILVVDDDADMRELIGAILQQEGAIVQAASSAREALQLFEPFQPRLVVSDIGMPEIDGYELMRQLKARFARVSPSIPAIALTAYAMEQDQQRALTAGFQQHIAKPIEPQELVGAIVALLQRE